MNIATVGTSWITDSFIKSAEYVDDVCIAGVYSRNIKKAEKFATDHNVGKYFSSFDEMLSECEIDSVYIASPNACHFEQAKKCLEAGKNVICEKPVVTEPEEIKELYSIANKKGLVLLEAMKSMHSKGLPIIRNNLVDLGEIHTASLDFSQLSSKYPLLKKWENSSSDTKNEEGEEIAIPNIFNPDLRTGALMDIGVYCIYFAVELFGKPDKIISHCDFLSTGADSSGTLIFIYDGLTVTITYSKIANGFSGGRILGENGAVTVKSISKLTDVKRMFNDGKVKQLYDEENEYKVMSEEIRSFRDFAKGLNVDYYNCCKETSLTVCEIMKEIRKRENFKF